MSIALKVINFQTKQKSPTTLLRRSLKYNLMLGTNGKMNQRGPPTLLMVSQTEHLLSVGNVCNFWESLSIFLVDFCQCFGFGNKML